MKKPLAKTLLILQWVFSIFFLLSGLVYIRSASCIFFFLAGLLLLSPLYKLFKSTILKKTKYDIPLWQKSIAIALAIIIGYTTFPKTQTSSATKSATTNNLTQSTTSISSSAKVYSVSSETSSSKTPTTSGIMTVDFIDVGQGDSELIQQGNDTMLIDSGPGKSESKLMSFLKTQNLPDIDYLVLTHGDEDHIGNADEVLDDYKVNNIIMTKYSNNTQAYKNLLTAVAKEKAEGAKVIDPEVGSNFSMNNQTKVNVFGPVNPNADDLNTCSIVLKVNFGLSPNK